MRMDVITLFPECFDALSVSKIWKRAVENQKLSLHLHNLRDFAKDKHHTVDDIPYGGGAGMILKIEPLVDALESIPRIGKNKVILLSPQGKCFDQKMAKSYVGHWDQLILVCGRYEGLDERFIEGWVDECLSIGDYVLSGGEIPAMVVLETLSRLIPGVLGDEESVETDSIHSGRLKYPQYTRPQDYRGILVPEVLTTGNHEKIRQWRQKKSDIRTLQMRPDLLKEVSNLPEPEGEKE